MASETASPTQLALREKSEAVALRALAAAQAVDAVGLLHLGGALMGIVSAVRAIGAQAERMDPEKCVRRMAALDAVLGGTCKTVRVEIADLPQETPA